MGADLLRFANPGSDINKLVRTFGYIASAAGDAIYDLDFMVGVAGRGSLVSSVGAVGEEAIRRSTRTDRSRDPMYNQLKMYSEIWRMLGWLHTGDRRLAFHTTPLGHLMAQLDFPLHDDDKSLLQQLFIGITFPNHQTENKGIDNLRPFRQLLLLMRDLDNRITRDEMIISLFTIVDDRANDAEAAAVARVRAIRGDFAALTSALVQTCQADSVQVNTARNYTRIPIGVLTSALTGWAVESTEKSTYRRSQKFFVLTEHGRATADALRTMTDVRWQDVSAFPPTVRAAFLNVAHYAMLERAGYESLSEQSEFLLHAGEVAAPAMIALGVGSRESLLFSPYQQAPASELSMADSFEGRWHEGTP